MFNGIFHVPQPLNEPVKDYAPGSAEKAEIKAQLKAQLATGETTTNPVGVVEEKFDFLGLAASVWF